MLRLYKYNYNVEIELHTNATALGFDAILLLQKQNNNALISVTYFNKAMTHVEKSIIQLRAKYISDNNRALSHLPAGILF